jgi:hypothetical protein
MASQEKPITPPPSEGGVARARGPGSGGARAGGGYPHPPDAAIPEATTLRD